VGQGIPECSFKLCSHRLPLDTTQFQAASSVLSSTCLSLGKYFGNCDGSHVSEKEISVASPLLQKFGWNPRKQNKDKFQWQQSYQKINLSQAFKLLVSKGDIVCIKELGCQFYSPGKLRGANRDDKKLPD